MITNVSPSYTMLIIGESECRRERDLWELFVLSVQFLFKPKTALKYETWGGGSIKKAD